MPQLNDLSRSLVALDQDSTIIAVVELSQSSWLVGGVLPGIERQPQKKLEPSAERLLGLLHHRAGQLSRLRLRDPLANHFGQKQLRDRPRPLPLQARAVLVRGAQG